MNLRRNMYKKILNVAAGSRLREKARNVRSKYSMMAEKLHTLKITNSFTIAYSKRGSSKMSFILPLPLYL